MSVTKKSDAASGKKRWKPWQKNLIFAAGLGLHSLLLNVSRQGIIFIPIILILPTYWGLRGVLYTPMVADLLSTILTLFYAFKAKSVLYNKENPINIRMR